MELLILTAIHSLVIFITLVNTISWAFYTVIIKRMLEKYHPVTVMKWTFTFGMFTTIPVGYGQWSTMDWSCNIFKCMAWE